MNFNKRATNKKKSQEKEEKLKMNPLQTEV